MSGLDMSGQELGAWLEMKQTQHVLAWLRDQIALYQRKIPQLILGERLDVARTATGALAAYEEILQVLESRPPEQPSTDDETFVDPATRFSLRRTAK
jgi:hypothetical protein